MKEHVLNNKIKVIYKKTISQVTSISISLDAGAAVEEKKLGVAHATEHMIYKGTKTRSEEEVNKDLSSIFGFQNAMTNYPYVIYYGSLLSEDFERGIEVFSDILMNPIFNYEGFKEEMDIIIEELNEWDEEVEQYCEDKLFFNSFNKRRIKYPIIGTMDSLKSITLEDIKEFYKKYYVPNNVSIAIVSSLEFEEIKNIIERYFGTWESIDYDFDNNEISEVIKSDIYIDYRSGINTCKVKIIFPIDFLNSNELRAFRIFNEYFGEGVNSILYDTLRTRNGIIYDVITKIAYEKHIKLYNITLSTSKENLNKALNLINTCIENLDRFKAEVYDIDLKQYIKTLKLKRLFREEQSIILAKELATYDTMFGDFKIYSEEFNHLEDITKDEILNVGKKVLKSPSIEIVSNVE